MFTFALRKRCPQVMIVSLGLFTASINAAECDYTPDHEKFDFSFTAYGAPDKSYVVTGNRFTKYEVASESGKLLNATIDIDATSLDTSHDLSNGMGGEWPDTIPPVRNSNVVNNLFMNFKNPGKLKASIAAITPETISLSVDMNKVVKPVEMTYTIENGVLVAKGTLDILDYKGKKAFNKFKKVCNDVWHKGKSWSTVDITFQVPVTEEKCN